MAYSRFNSKVIPWAFPQARRRRALVALAVIALATTGCGKKAVPGRVPVVATAGKITYAGRVPEGALVALHPKDPSSSTPKPTAKVRSDGTFQFSTYETGDGAPAGQYVATVSWRLAVRDGGDFAPGPELIPAKYASPQTSDLFVTVGGAPNTLPPFTLNP